MCLKANETPLISRSFSDLLLFNLLQCDPHGKLTIYLLNLKLAKLLHIHHHI